MTRLACTPNTRKIAPLSESSSAAEPIWPARATETARAKKSCQELFGSGPAT
jgi:hypothetical protein